MFVVPAPLSDRIRALSLGRNASDCDGWDCGISHTDVRPEMPSSYYLELTSVCNNRCPGCGNNFADDYTRRALAASTPRPFLNLEGWRLILDKIASHAEYLRVTGGEPTIHPEFEEIARHIDQLGTPFALFTNGRWRNPSGMLNFLSGVSTLQSLLVSLHGADAATHEAFTGVRGSFNETVTNIRLATDAGLAVRVSTVITHQNFCQLAQVAQLAHGLGAIAIAFDRFLVPPEQAQMVEHLLPNAEELTTAVDIVEQMRAATSEHWRVFHGPCIPQCFVQSASRGCSAGETFCAIDPWGNVMPCTHTRLACGNLLTQDVKDVWGSEPMREWQSMLSDDCADCSMLAQCKGGCRAMAFESGLGYDPLMKATKPAQTLSPPLTNRQD